MTIPLFKASEGPAGTGNPLTYDELLSLGTRTVGAGPNAGTLVRVTNAGGGAMALRAPILGGTDLNDFWVDIESATLPMVVGDVPLVDSPFHELDGAGGPGLALGIDAAELLELAPLHEVALRDFWLPDLGAVTLALRRRPLPFHADSKLVLDGRELPGGFERLAGELQVWSGQVAGIAGSRVFLVVDGSSGRGFVDLPGTRRSYVVSDGPGRLRIVREQELEYFRARARPELCAGERFVPGKTPPSRSPVLQRVTAQGLVECRLAIETDFDLYQFFNSTTLLTNYVVGLVAAVSDQYFTDVQATLAIAYLGIHTDANDGWTSEENGDVGTLLDEFMAAWGTTWPVEADLAHFLSGASLGGGLGFVDVLCNHQYGFAVSTGLFADIDWQSWTGAPGNYWDYLVFAHELGHNFGSLHTHNYCPPFDHCSVSNCEGTQFCTRGTLMGYCHQCPGGVSNVDLIFHPATANIIRAALNASCLGALRLDPGDFVQYRVRFNPLFRAGEKNATLEFGHDATNLPQPFRIRLAGTAN